MSLKSTLKEAIQLVGANAAMPSDTSVEIANITADETYREIVAPFDGYATLRAIFSGTEAKRVILTSATPDMIIAQSSLWMPRTYTISTSIPVEKGYKFSYALSKNPTTVRLTIIKAVGASNVTKK